MVAVSCPPSNPNAAVHSAGSLLLNHGVHCAQISKASPFEGQIRIRTSEEKTQEHDHVLAEGERTLATSSRSRQRLAATKMVCCRPGPRVRHNRNWWEIKTLTGR